MWPLWGHIVIRNLISLALDDKVVLVLGQYCPKVVAIGEFIFAFVTIRCMYIIILKAPYSVMELQRIFTDTCNPRRRKSFFEPKKGSFSKL